MKLEENNIMKLVNYAEYKHSYAHALEPKLKALNFRANVQHKPVAYIKKIIFSALNQPEVHFTGTEQTFLCSRIRTKIESNKLSCKRST